MPSLAAYNESENREARVIVTRRSREPDLAMQTSTTFAPRLLYGARFCRSAHCDTFCGLGRTSTFVLAYGLELNFT